MAKIRDYLRVGEAAEYLGVSKDTLRRWDAAGKLKAYRNPASNFRLYRLSDLEKFLARVAGRSAAAGTKAHRRTTKSLRRPERSK